MKCPHSAIPLSCISRVQRGQMPGFGPSPRGSSHRALTQTLRASPPFPRRKGDLGLTPSHRRCCQADCGLGDPHLDKAC